MMRREVADEELQMVAVAAVGLWPRADCGRKEEGGWRDEMQLVGVVGLVAATRGCQEGIWSQQELHRLLWHAMAEKEERKKGQASLVVGWVAQ